MARGRGPTLLRALLNLLPTTHYLMHSTNLDVFAAGGAVAFFSPASAPALLRAHASETPTARTMAPLMPKATSCMPAQPALERATAASSEAPPLRPKTARSLAAWRNRHVGPSVPRRDYTLHGQHGHLRADPLRGPCLLLQRGGSADEAQVPPAPNECLRGGEGGEGASPREHHTRTSGDERCT